LNAIQPALSFRQILEPLDVPLIGYLSLMDDGFGLSFPGRLPIHRDSEVAASSEGLAQRLYGMLTVDECSRASAFSFSSGQPQIEAARDFFRILSSIGFWASRAPIK
jgi:hypothetical protein